MAPTTPGGPGEGGERHEEAQVVGDLKEAVPGASTEYNHNERYEIYGHWTALMGEFQGIQNHINELQRQNKELQNDKIFNKPEFRAQYKENLKRNYEQLRAILPTLPNVAQATKRDIIRASQEIQNENRGTLLRANEAVVQALLEQRRQKLEQIGDVMRENLVSRLRHLRRQWTEQPPNGYADVRDSWISYTEQLERTLMSQDLAALDNGRIDFPNGNTVYEDAKKWWNVVNQLEDSYADFVRYGEGRAVTAEGQFEDLTDAALQAEFETLKTQVAHDFDAAAIAHFKESVGKLMSEAENVREEIQYRMDNDPGQRKFWEDQMKLLEDKVKQLKEHQNIEEAIQNALHGTRTIATYKAPNGEGGTIDVPEGIEGQLQFLRKAPMTNDARRSAARLLSEGMKEVANKIRGYKDFDEVQLTETLENMRLFRESIDSGDGEVTKEIIFINPFETMSQFWHTVTETVKGNVETQAGRGAGYFTKEATEILTKIPNPTNNQIIKSLTELNPNGAQHAEHKEHGRVSDIEKGYEAFNTEHLGHVAAETIDRFEFKACLNLLAKRGRVDFYAPWLFKQLNRWQKTIKIPEDKYWHQKNLTASEEMMRQAYIYIYRDSEAFKSMKNQNASAYESKMGEYSKGWGSIAAEPGALVNEAERILKQYESDHDQGKHFSTADPIKFESIIRYAVDQGKMKAEARMRLMVRGLATGLLPFDRGVNITDKNNTYPPFDWFDTGHGRGDKPTIDDIKELDAYAKDPVMWDYYMHKRVMYNEQVYQRLDKTLTQGSHRVDHDDAPMLAGYLSLGTVKDMLTQKTSGGYGMPKTGLLSLATGNEFWLDMYAELYAGRDQKINNREIVRFASQFLMYEGILNRRAYKTTNMFRMEPSDAEQKPRTTGKYAKVFGRAEQGTGNLIKGVANHLAMLDFDADYPLIRRMINNQITDDTQAASIAKKLDDTYGVWKGDPPKTINDLYERIAPYLEYAVQNPTNLERMVANLRGQHVAGGHTRHEADILGPGQHDFDEVRATARRRSEGEDVDGHHGHHDHGHGGHGHGGHGHGGHGHGEHAAEGHDGDHSGGGHGDDHGSHGSTPVGGGPTAHGSTHGGGH